MERSKQIQLGLAGVIALLLIANLFGGGFKSWLGMSEGDKIRQEASLAAPSSGTVSETAANNSGNIPGTNEIGDDPQPSGPLTEIKYEEEKYEYGIVDEGDIVKHAFKFKNVGKEPLLITNARGSCGCTVPTWPREPIAPGATGEIKVEFNTKGKPGPQSKRVTVTANTNPTDTYLEVTGEVKGKDQSAKGQ